MVDRNPPLPGAARLDVTVWDEQRLVAEASAASARSVAIGSPPRLVRLDLSGRWGAGGCVGWPDRVGRQGNHVRPGGPVAQAPRQHEVDEDRHVRGGRVVATMSRCIRLGVRHRVTALLPLAENLPGADRCARATCCALRRSLRRVPTPTRGPARVADGGVRRRAPRPAVVIDLATLPGAATPASAAACGAVTRRRRRARRLVDADGAAGERLWPMPLVDDYRERADSPVADLCNIGDPANTTTGGSSSGAVPAPSSSVPCRGRTSTSPARPRRRGRDNHQGAAGFGVGRCCGTSVTGFRAAARPSHWRRFRDRACSDRTRRWLVTDLVNIRYLTGFTGSAGCSSSAPTGHVVTDERYGEQAVLSRRVR